MCIRDSCGARRAADQHETYRQRHSCVAHRAVVCGIKACRARRHRLKGGEQQTGAKRKPPKFHKEEVAKGQKKQQRSGTESVSYTHLIGDVDIIQVYRLLANLHSLAVDFSYSKIDKDTILHLKEINRQLSNAIQAKDNAMSRASDTAFHNIFLNLADNDFLSRFTSTLSAHVARVENVYFGNISDTKDSVLSLIHI